jgi:hypothetical protein
MGAAQPYPCTGTIFSDVNSLMGEAFCGYVEHFSSLGITGGCQADDPATPDINEAMYCPGAEVTRAQMAVFVTKEMDTVMEAVNAAKGPPGKTDFIKTTNVRINGGNQQAHIQPEANFTVTFDYNCTVDFCPHCFAQLYVGLNSDIGPQACPYSAEPGPSPGTTGGVSVVLTAPTTPGVYYIGIDWSLEFQCFGGGPNWPHGAPSTNDRIIGSISVY